MLKTDALQTFVTIVEAGSLSEASRRLRVSKSVVSDRLAELEAELGSRLVHRSARHLRVSEDGEAFFQAARQILLDLDEAVSAIADRKNALRGSLRISGPVSFGSLHLGRALYPFLAAHPDIQLSLDLNDRVIDLVGEGYDVAVRIGRLPDSSLVARKLSVSRRVVVLSPDYAQRKGVPETVADLSQHRAITYANRRAYDDWQFNQDGNVVSARVASTLQVNNGDIQRDAAIAGLGIAVLPTFIVAEAVKSGQLIVAPLSAEPVADGVYVVYPPNRHLSAKIRALIEHLGTSFGSPPYWDQAIFGDQAAAPIAPRAAVLPPVR